MRTFAYAALWGAAMGIAAPASAQEAAITSGGNVTAEQATPLPPVVVEAPSKPLTPEQPKKKTSVGSGSAAATASPVQGEASGEGVAGAGVGIYTLGQLDMIGGSTITNEAMWTFDKNSVDQALSILPGVTMHSAGGSRNERNIFVRGFDRLRVPLYMDGVRISLPADNRLDFGRFLTPDLSEIQVEKGYVSVLNGPGGMGGAINLVSRKPTKELETEARVGAVFDGDLSSMGQWSAYAYGGTRQKGFYAQISGTIVDQDHFDMSNDFTPTAPGSLGYDAAKYSYEDGGNRDRSAFEDWRINAKVGITPNATDEYSINITNQQSERDAPLHTGRQIVQGIQLPTPDNVARFWDWNTWDVASQSWLSKTKIGDATYIKTNAYYNTFENKITFFRDKDFSIKRMDSPYDDHSYGGFVELGTDLIPMNTLKGTVHYRRDEHWEQGVNYDTSGNFKSFEAAKTQSEETWSYAAENTFHATRAVDFVTGLSYDTNEVLRADGTKLALPQLEKWNWQGAAIYRYARGGEVHADVSSRTRFPTLFDRYSTRFGGRSEQPDLDAERATNYEIGFSDTFFSSLHVSSAVFYSDIEGSIETAYSGPNSNGSLVVYNADGDNRGFEMSVDWDATRTLRIGGNYTYLERELNFFEASRSLPAGTTTQQIDAVALSQLEGTPKHEIFLYASWKPFAQLTLTPSMEIATDRTALVTSCASTLVYTGADQLGGPPAANLDANRGACNKPSTNPIGSGNAKPNYVNLGSYALLNFQAEYAFTDYFTTAVGVTNLLDQNFSLADGFPEPGRQFYATARAKF